MEFFRMAELKPVTPEVLLHISKTLQVPMKGLVATIGLLDEGGTVPFIARYRKEATGNLDEVQIRSIAEKLAYFRELQDRRACCAVDEIERPLTAMFSEWRVIQGKRIHHIPFRGRRREQYLPEAGRQVRTIIQTRHPHFRRRYV
jgi:Tex-like protein N-terminal domain